MNRRIVILTLVLVCLASLAQAQQRGGRGYHRTGQWDFTFQTRYTTEQTFDGDHGTGAKLHDSLGWGFGFNYHLNERFDLGAAFTWRQVPYDATAVDVNDPTNLLHYNGKLSVSSAGLTANWNPLDGPLTPYVTGSAAWTLIDTNIFAGWGNGCWWDYWWGPICGPVPYTYGKNTGSYNLGVGVRYELTETFFIRAGWEHGWLSLDRYSGGHMIRIDLGLIN